MCGAVPSSVPGIDDIIVGDCVSELLASRDSLIFARPKSSSFTAPPGLTLTLAGFRSRWTMP